MARRPYSTDCRFFKDSGTIVRVRWYPVTLPVQCLPFPSKINSLDWSSHPWLAEGVGEVYGGDRPYNAAEVIDYARGLTPCQPAEVFAEGEQYDPLAPAQEYDEKGLALCCVNDFTASGGVRWDGSAVVTVVSPLVPNTCGGAGAAPLGVTVEGTLPPGAIYWYTLGNLSGAHRYHIRYGFPLPPGGVQWTCTPWSVPCSLASGASDFGTIEEERDITVFTSPTYLSFYLFNPDGSNPRSFRFKLTVT